MISYKAIFTEVGSDIINIIGDNVKLNNLLAFHFEKVAMRPKFQAENNIPKGQDIVGNGFFIYELDESYPAKKKHSLVSEIGKALKSSLAELSNVDSSRITSIFKTEKL